MKNPPKKLQRCTLPTTFEFNNMIWTANNNVPLDHKPMVDNIATTNPPPPPLDPMKNKSTPEWQLKSPALGQQKSTPKWQRKSPASGQPSAPMA